MAGLKSGDRLGPYEIVALLGAGGMGEVYRARDLRLGRDVALKILPADAANDEAWRQRFAREARAASALSHPNVATIHDFAESEGRAFIVMEHVEGETLAASVARRRASARSLVDIALQIAEALDEAHSRGITHRDIKPANVMITPKGRVKVLDFGVARLQHRTTPDAATTVVTAPGNAIGTLPYMSPEQALGLEVDGRSDIFSLGTLMYELATGRRAFEGATPAETSDRILHRQPAAIASLNRDMPPEIDRIVRKCLEKERERRYQTASELAVDLQNLKRDLDSMIPLAASDAVVDTAVGRRRTWNARSAGGLALATLAILTVVAVWQWLRTPNPARDPMVFEVAPPEALTLSNSVAASPDGRYLAMTAAGDDAIPAIWIRSMASEEVRRLPGTEGALYPFWSPDSNTIAFFATAKLKRIDIAPGAPVQIISDATPLALGGSWGSRGTIVFAPSGGVLQRVSAGGGPVVPVTTRDDDRNESDHRWPAFLPDGRHVLFMSRTRRSTDRSSLAVARVDGEPTAHRILTSATSSGLYFDGHVLFLRGRTLLKQRFDAESLTLRETAVPVRSDVWISPGWEGLHGCTAAARSLVACRTGATQTELVWLDRTGKPLGRLDVGPTANPELSPDESAVAFGSLDYELRHDVLVLASLTDPARPARRRLIQRNVEGQIWSPDGKRIVYASDAEGTFDLFAVETSGAAVAEVLYRSNLAKFPLDWSSDSKWVLFTDLKRLWALSIQDRRPLSVQAGSIVAARFSPDGKWIAYSPASWVTQSEVYVVPFPGPGEPSKVSIGGGSEPRWRADGREIYYVGNDRRIMAVDVADSPDRLRFGRERPLFEARPFNTGYTYSYDVTARGDRFLITKVVERGRIAVMLNLQ